MEHKVIIDLRSIVDQYLRAQHQGRPTSDSEWNLIATYRWPSAFKPEVIAARIQQWREATGSMPAPPFGYTTQAFRADPARRAREELLSYLLSAMAARLPAVEDFRLEVLDGKLLRIADVQPWIKARARTEGFALWLEVAVKPDSHGSVYLNRPASISKSRPAADFQLKWLTYTLPGRPSQRISTAEGCVLDRLRRVSEHVASQTGCSPDDATVFILSGAPLPYFSCLRTVVISSTDLLSGLNRIELKIDPTLSPRQVAEMYRQLRAEVFGRRYRAMSEKHIRLALFAFQRPPNQRIKDAMAEWNTMYKKWRYRLESHFGRDRIVARRRAFETLNVNRTSRNTIENWFMGHEQATGGER
jgi:hypothetical protein